MINDCRDEGMIDDHYANLTPSELCLQRLTLFVKLTSVTVHMKSTKIYYLNGKPLATL
mgnify:CR=1 FL=1